MTKLIFKRTDEPRIMAWLFSALKELKENAEYIIEIKTRPKKRSLNANAYAWVLIDKLSEYYRLPPEYIYHKAVRDIGGNTLIVSIEKEAEETLVRTWESKGLGWLAEKTDEYRNTADYRLTYGSSVYNTHQMSRLIENLVQDCIQADIEILPAEELNSMIKGWNGGR